MAARAIVGILLGILFAPVLFLLLASIGDNTAFATWFWSMTSDLTSFLTGWMGAGVESGIAPLFQSLSYPNGLIEAFGPGVSLLSNWIPTYAPALITWVVIGAWAGSVERSAGRGIGVGIGIWLGWLIIGIIGGLVMPLVINPIILDVILGMLLTAIVVIIVAAIFGAMTKSEEF